MELTSHLAEININRIPKMFAPYLTSLAVLIGGMLVAVQFRLNIHLGKNLGEDYEAHNWELYALIAIILMVAYAAAWGSARIPAFAALFNPRRQFRVIVLAVVLINAILLPPGHVSSLQLLYFTLATIVIAGLVIAVPGRLSQHQPTESMSAHLRNLWDYRGLLKLWLKFNIKQRYSQTILGILWIILIPLSYAFVLAFAFSNILQVKVSNVPYISYFMSGLVAFGLFNQSIQSGTRAVLTTLGLMNQVYFPREILILVTLGEGLVDLIFTFSALLLINMLHGIFPNEHFIFLIPVLLPLLFLTCGLMFFLGALSVLIRDIPQLTGVLLQLIFYTTPIIYPVERLPEKYEFVLLLNPLAPIIMSVRDIMIYNRTPEFVNLFYPFVLSIVCLYVGYAFFKSKEDSLADYR